MRSRRYKILVVEDNPGDVQLIGEAFKDCGAACDLIFADSLASAKQLLDHQGFDFMITDMSVRDGESVDFIRQVRSDAHSHIVPIIVLSGAADVRPAYEAGANAFIAKPLRFDELTERIRALMHFWTQTAELPPRG